MELAAPITIHWDLGPEQGQVERICHDIINCRPLMLQLFSPVLEPECAAIEVLKCFKESPIAISLTVPTAALSDKTTILLADFKLKELLISGGSVADIAAGWGAVFGYTGAVKGISFQVTRSNYLDLPAMLGFCRQHAIKRLVLPMQRLYEQEAPFFITKQEQQQLSDLLESAGGTQGMNLTIHDPFIWRAFHPAIPFPQAGCQAANTMLAIDPKGNVYPCPALPVVLGTLAEGSLKEIILSGAKKDFRRGLLQQPAQCLECGEVEVCRGGCRGRSYVLQGSLDGIDVACR